MTYLDIPITKIKEWRSHGGDRYVMIKHEPTGYVETVKNPMFKPSKLSSVDRPRPMRGV
jgi:hypothetical protein